MQFLRNCWYMAAWVSELEVNPHITRTVLGRPLLIFRDDAGRLRAFDDRCPHRSAPLSRGRRVEGRIVCGYHGLEFNMDGRCVHSPHPSGKIPKSLQLVSYALFEKHDIVWIWMGHRDPDPALIPDFHKLEEGGVTRHDHLLMSVPFDLIVDNLLDCSHTSFVHEGILGNAEMIAAPTRVEQNGNTINVSRYARSVTPPRMINMQFKNDCALVDTWTDFRWNAPSCLLLDTGVTSPGASREEGTGYFGIHILTPESETTTHYFTAASRWNIRPDLETEEMRLKISDLRRFAFEKQDEPMIAAQFRNLSTFPPEETKPILIETDIGVVRWRRIMNELLATERTPVES